MNQSLGTIITGIVTDINDKAYFVQKSGITYELPKTETTSYELGDAVEGFAYVSLNKDYKLTQDLPKVQIGQYAFSKVIDVRRDLGVFVDIGLPDKEIVVSLDELPTEKQLWPKKGDQLLVTLRVDEKDRMWGELADEEFFVSLSKKASEELVNKDIKGIAYRLKVVGTYVLTEGNHLGFIHPSQRDAEPRLGEEISGRVIGIGQEGTVNISLKPRAHEAIPEDAAMLLAILERSRDGSFPYTDKSSPEEIKLHFGISKGQFKRAIGNLLKQRKIVQVDGETRLVKNDSAEQE
ncbi:S1 RNA-binding domain-containing protein [Desemzia sp. FAM 24101]|uniref:CvfB family protein n=1 Tax=unclassified Desemzia TaxID=2685243 RepID=UPI003889A4C3